MGGGGGGRMAVAAADAWRARDEPRQHGSNPARAIAALQATSRSNFAGSNFANRAIGQQSGNWRGRHRGYGGFGAGFAAGALIGSAPYYYGGGYYDDGYAYGGDYAYGDDGYDTYGSSAAAPEGGADVAYCAQRFQSYDPSSGTYLGYDGLRHPCP